MSTTEIGNVLPNNGCLCDCLDMSQHLPLCAQMGERLVMYCQTTSVSAAHALRIVLLTAPRVGRSYELFSDGFYLHLLPEEALLDSHLHVGAIQGRT
jgi:hypothetical protein